MDTYASAMNSRKQPPLDIAICSVCGWRGPTSECPKHEDGEWETGLFDVCDCPRCEDGGMVDDYDYSPEQHKRYEEWRLAKPQ